ncbi:hypothetical protein, partial [Streptomyces rapamycinicus]|uniref:hypothetical protein n=1 Tax=Streptomyces rapamycinicus TaxID=1226757 RepID=UPI003B8A79E4
MARAISLGPHHLTDPLRDQRFKHPVIENTRRMHDGAHIRDRRQNSRERLTVTDITSHNPHT